MPNVSVIIPTCNRPVMLKRAIASVLAQTYHDFEIIIVDDGMKERAESVVNSFHDPRITYIAHEQGKGGAAARNTGIRAAKGEFVAFLDDDEWVSEKLEIQMKAFEHTPPDVGFCFSAVTNIRDGRESATSIPDGMADYHERALRRFAGFLTVTLVIKKEVFSEVEMFDERFPSHQEPDLMIRVTKKYKGVAVNKPLVRVSMATTYEHVGSDLARKIAGREMILQKYFDEFKQYPAILANHYFWLGILYRDSGQFEKARKMFAMAWHEHRSARYLIHYFLVLFGRYWKAFGFFKKR